ncbi:MAG: glutamate 5-kinase [Bacteroidales bacterium]|nr:glutamate 5-kinase [Bacteroidales bacterium]
MRIVVKIGSNVLTRADGNPDISRMSLLVDQMAAIRDAGHELIVVTSGAVACGRAVLHHEDELDKVEQRQLFSAVGQANVVSRYSSFFAAHGYNVGQVLIMKENFLREEEYANLKRCMRVMLEYGVIPVVNENDTVSVTELMFTDNDELSGLLAKMIGADLLVILSNMDGLYTGDPSDPASSLVPEVRVGQDVSAYISASKSSAGRGGMESKCATALSLAEAGVKVIIANGKRDNVLTFLLNEPSKVPHTEFYK